MADQELGESEDAGNTAACTADSGQTSSLRRQLLKLAFLLLPVLATGILVNWPYDYTAIMPQGVWAAQMPRVDRTELEDYQPSYRQAGWPWNYAITVTYHDAEPLQLFSWQRLLGNIGLVFCCCAIATFHTLRRPKNAGASSKHRFRIRLSDLLILILLLAVGLGYWQLLKRRSERDEALARELSTHGGSVGRSGLVPSFLAPHLPNQLQTALLRIRRVEITEPSDEIIEQVVDLPYLETLRLGGGDYDARRLEALAGNPYLWQLRLAGRSFADSNEIAWIAQMPQLRTLNLMRTNVNVKFLHSLDKLTRLRDLDIMHTDVELAQLGRPNWADHIERLRLPRPAAGQQGKVTIQGWPKLKSLCFFDYDEFLNPTPMTLDLGDLPELDDLKLDVMQRFDLYAKQIPQLKTIDPIFYQAMSRVSRYQVVPATLWVRDVAIDSLPKLDVLYLYGPDLESLKLANRPTNSVLRIAASVYPADSTTPVQIATISNAMIDHWFRDLTAEDCPETVSLAGVSLFDLDLSPLQKTSIQSLDLSGTETNFGQWQQLKGMADLKELQLADCPIEGSEVGWLIENLPRLEKLLIDGSYLTRLQLEQNVQLQELVVNADSPFFSSLRLVESGNLKTRFSLGDEIHYLHVENSPGLSGLVLKSRIPTNSVLKGIGGLDTFSAGGPEVGDAIWDELLQSKQSLRKLSLVYTSISPQNLARLSEFQQLEKVVLAGDNIDATVIEALCKIESLKAIALEDTQIPEAAFKKLTSLRALKDLTISPKQPTFDLHWIGQIDGLLSCTLKNVNVSAELLEQIMSKNQLVKLGFENTTLSAKTLAPLTNKPRPTLKEMNFNRCSVDSASLFQIAQLQTSVLFSFSSVNIDARLVRQLEQSLRTQEPLFNTSVADYSTRLASGKLEDWMLVDPELLDPQLFVIHLARAPRTQASFHSSGIQEFEAPSSPGFLDILETILTTPPLPTTTVDTREPEENTDGLPARE